MRVRKTTDVVSKDEIIIVASRLSCISDIAPVGIRDELCFRTCCFSKLIKTYVFIFTVYFYSAVVCPHLDVETGK